MKILAGGLKQKIEVLSPPQNLSHPITLQRSSLLKTFTRTLVLGLMAICMSISAYADELSAQDYTEIQQLYAQYNWAIDTGDAEGYANTFTADGTFNNMSGHDALKGFIKRWVESMSGANRLHWNTNLHITGDGKTAKGKVYLMLLDKSTSPPAIITTATYNDELVKTADGWRFSKRATKSDRPPASQAK